MDEASRLASTMRVTVSKVLLVAFSLAITQARAAENATGLYLLGIKTSMAGFVPPPGTYVTDINYAYSGDAGGRRPWEWRYAGRKPDRRSGRRCAGNAYINLPIELCSFAFGIAGYHYQQITGDSGAGARLGASKAALPPLGPTSPTPSCAAKSRSAPSSNTSASSTLRIG